MLNTVHCTYLYCVCVAVTL